MTVSGVPTTALAESERQKERSERSEATHVVTQTADTPREKSRYEIPDDAEYEPDKVLVGVPEDSTAEDVAAKLMGGNVEGVEPLTVTKVTDDVISVDFPQGTNLEDTINRLVDSGVSDTVEPNYVAATLETEDEVEVAPEQDPNQQQVEEPLEEPITVVEQTNDSEVIAEEEVTTPNDDATEKVPDADSVPEADSDASTEMTLGPQSAYHNGVQASSVVNDARAQDQWGLESMYVPEVWKAGIRCNKNVSVAVLDTKINTQNPDINDNIVPNSSYNATTDSGSDGVSYASRSHGNHVAGIIAAEANNSSIGIAGVSYNARIVPVQIYGEDSDSAYTEDIIRGIDYVIQHKNEWNIRVINYSSASYYYNKLFNDAWNRAYKAGIVVVASASNESSTDPTWPSDYPTVVGVMALQNTSDIMNGVKGRYRYPTQVSLADFSNYNDYGKWGIKGRNIAAPGVAIWSHAYSNSSDDLLLFDGTSMAAPQVSGVFALMFAANSSLTPDKAMALLYASARDLGQTGWDNSYGYGEVNAAYAVYLAKGYGAQGGLGLSPKPSSNIVPSFDRPYVSWSAPRFMSKGTSSSRSWWSTETSPWSFESSDTSVVQVSRNGSTLSFNAVGKGEAIVNAKYNGVVVDSTLVNVMSGIGGPDTIGIGGEDLCYVEGGELFTWSWSTDNSRIASVDSDGYVTGVGIGTTTIRATCTSSDGNSIELTKSITVTNAKDIWNTYVSLPDNFTYTGAPITPKPEVEDWDTYVKLKEGVDYRLRYENNKDVGEARVYVEGIGKYYSYYYVTYKIVPATLTATYADATITRGKTAPTTVKVTGFVGGESAATAKGYKAPSVNITASQRNTVGTYKITPYGGSATNYTFTYRAGTLKVNAPASNSTPHVSYRTHVQRIGWQKFVSDGAMSGTSGRSFRLEGINVKLSNLPVSGGIQYRTHVQKIGWQGWRKDGAMAGTSGKSYRLEAIEIKLYGEMAKKYDVYYRVHCQKFGWMGWAKNGQRSGSAGYSRRLEGIQIVLVKKGSAAPGATYKGIKQNVSRAFAQKK